MKNFQKIALGLVVGATAFGFSAFTNATKSIPDNFLIQRAVNQVTPSGTTTPDPLKCETPTSLNCFYNVTALGKTNIPSLSSLGQTYYTPTQIATYITNGWLTVPAQSSKALYTGI